VFNFNVVKIKHIKTKKMPSNLIHIGKKKMILFPRLKTYCSKYGLLPTNQVSVHTKKCDLKIVFESAEAFFSYRATKIGLECVLDHYRITGVLHLVTNVSFDIYYPNNMKY
jgi:hypothetical protein